MPSQIRRFRNLGTAGLNPFGESPSKLSPSISHRRLFWTLQIGAIENYLKIERWRFERRVNWQVDVSPEAREAWVPTSLLPSLVENAIKYGLQTSPEHLQVRRRTVLRDRAVDAFVKNSGHWIEPDLSSTRSTGLGLSNLRRRLALLCGHAARVGISFPMDLCASTCTYRSTPKPSDATPTHPHRR